MPKAIAVAIVVVSLTVVSGSLVWAVVSFINLDFASWHVLRVALGVSFLVWLFAAAATVTSHD